MTTQPLTSAQVAADRLTDGEWHRLHPATPLLKGGFVFIAVLGVVISNLRERLVGLFVGQPDVGDPINAIVHRGLVGIVLGIVALVLILCIAVFYLSWRMHTFRIGAEEIEVRSGILSRKYRKARLDRIQAINVVRPVFARIFGAAKLEVSVAGHDANVHLEYLSSSLADALRRDVLTRASGVIAAEVAAGAGGAGGAAGPTGAAGATGALDAPGLVNRRVNEFLAPELDPEFASPASVVRITPFRLAGSIVLSSHTVTLLVIAGVLVAASFGGGLWLLILFLPTLLGFASVYVRRFTKSLRYSIAGTPDGVRVGFGLFSTSNATLPPGRIHAIDVSQPLAWRPFGWWQVRIDTAQHSREKGAAGHHETTILPVGSLADARRVFGLLLPGLDEGDRRQLIEDGMTSNGGDAYLAAPHRAVWVRPLSWRRTGYLLVDGVILIRHGVLRRRLVVVPLARLQSLEVHQGPLGRVLRLASARFHTVEGPVRPRLPIIDRDQAVALFDEVSREAVASAGRDTSHRWNEVRGVHTARVASQEARPVDGVRPEGTQV